LKRHISKSQPYCLTAPLGSRDVIGHVTIWYPIGHFLLVVLWNQASTLTVSKVFNVKCNSLVDTDLDTTSKQRSRYQSISHIWLPIGCQQQRLL